MKMLATAAAALALSTSAFAADLPTKKAPVEAPVMVSPWDFEVGASLTTDYIFRGITQSNHAPSVWAHGELRYNINDMFQLYAGVSGESIKLTNVGPSPSMELDGYGGLRVTYGNFGLDLGGIYYGYPNTPQGIVGVTTLNPVFSPKPISWFELYAKPSYNFTDWLSIGANFYYTPSYLNTGASGEYLSATAKVTLPYGFSVSGEIGHQWLGTTDFVWFNPAAPFLAANAGFTPGKLPSYTYWNVGASYTYKFVTLDVRYHGTSLSRAATAQFTGNANNGANFAGQNLSTYGRGAIVGTISFALTGKDLK
ncbi:MAG TPA: TorF family putative porin [Rhodoblastus sp.]|nr:TorF family putative porin [Rhodoblastus sp.]